MVVLTWAARLLLLLLELELLILEEERAGQPLASKTRAAMEVTVNGSSSLSERGGGMAGAATAAADDDEEDDDEEEEEEEEALGASKPRERAAAGSGGWRGVVNTRSGVAAASDARNAAGSTVTGSIKPRPPWRRERKVWLRAAVLGPSEAVGTAILRSSVAVIMSRRRVAPGRQMAGGMVRNTHISEEVTQERRMSMTVWREMVSCWSLSKSGCKAATLSMTNWAREASLTPTADPRRGRWPPVRI